METLNILPATKKQFIGYMGILQQAHKKTFTQDEALKILLDSFWKHFPEEFKVKAT
jgi:hypothetical protein